MLGWAAPAYLKKEGATPHPGGHRHGLQYDERPDWLFWVQFSMWNIGSLSGKGGEVCEELRKRMIDVCCLQEVRWRVQGDRVLQMERGHISCGGLEKEMWLVVCIS